MNTWWILQIQIPAAPRAFLWSTKTESLTSLTSSAEFSLIIWPDDSRSMLACINSVYVVRLAAIAHNPAAESSDPPARLNRRCARDEVNNLLADPANIAYSEELRVARITKVVDRIHNCCATGLSAVMNCGRKATKKIMPLGLSAVTSQVLANSRHLEPGALGVAISRGEKPARSSLMPRNKRYNPATHLTAVNHTAEVARRAPRPSNETTSAVESPNATAITRGIFALFPCATE